MSFSKEDKKKVFDFFEKLLLEKFPDPIYYEQLRGYVSNSESVIKKYVTKECKGEKLLHYFQTRKNYFLVNFRNEVMLLNKKKSIKDTTSKANKLDGEQYAISSEDISSEELTHSDYSNRSRSTSINSTYGSETSSHDDVFVAANTNKKPDYEKETLNYFSDYLAFNPKLSLHDIEIKCLPKPVKHYVTKYFKKDFSLFFKSNPETFHMNETNSVSLVSSQKCNQSSTVETEEETTLPIDDIISLNNFIHCAEFFFGILKKKSLPLNYLSGHLSKTTPDVSEYLKINYATFKDFFLDADKLFVLNDNEEVAVSKSGPKSLKIAKKLLQANSIILPQSLKREIYSYLKSETSKNQNSLSDKDQLNNCSDVNHLEISNMENSDEDKLHLNKSEKVKVEKRNIYDEEHNNIESIYCNNLDNLNSAKKEKLKAEKPNILVDENINISCADFNKILEDDLKNESIIANLCEEKVIEVVEKELDWNVDEILETSVDHDESRFDKMKSSMRNFIECVFIIQLFCLELVEKQLILCYKYEYEAVKYFVEVLEKLHFEVNVDSLKGSLGQASKEVNFFMKTLYKNDKMYQFFEKHDEFNVTNINYSNAMSTSKPSGILTLNPTYKNDLEDKRKVHDLYTAGTKMYDVFKLYNTQLFDMFIDALDCLIKICSFLQYKHRIKLTRLSSVKFSPSQQNFINLLNGTAVYEKLESFLCCFGFLDITEGYIELDHEHLDVTLFKDSVTKFTQERNILITYEKFKLVYPDYLLDFLQAFENEYAVMNFDELKGYIIGAVENFLSCCPNLEYSDLPNVFGYEVLHNLVLEKQDSQYLIKLLEESNLFLLNDGKISYRQENDEEMHLIPDSNSSDKLYSEDSKNEKLETSVSENTYVKVNDVCHEDLEISFAKKSSLTEVDISVDAAESKSFHTKLTNENSEVGFLSKSNFSHHQQDKQTDLNHENDFGNMLISSTSAKNATVNSESRMQDECSHSDIPPSKETVLNLKTDSDMFFVPTYNKQEVEIVSGSHCVNDAVVKEVKSSINKSNNERKNTDLTIEQNNLSNIDEINLSVSSTESPKSSHLINSNMDYYSNVWEDLSKPSANAVSFPSSVKKNIVSETCMQISSSINDIDLNCVENIPSIENVYEKKNVENVSSISTCTMNLKEKQWQGYDCEPDSERKKCIKNASLDENLSSSNIKSHPISNMESSHNNKKTDQIKTSNTGNESVTSTTFVRQPMSKNDSIESDSEGDKPLHNFNSTFLQPLHAKIIILTLDSCIAETVVNNLKKCIFCLKSCFHCDLHSDCSDCFNSLAVGGEILCYIPPTEDLNCGNMCFAFMFHKDSGTQEISERSLDAEDYQRSSSNQIVQAKYSSKNSGAASDKDNVHNQHLQSNSDKFPSSVIEEHQVPTSCPNSQSLKFPYLLSKSAPIQSLVVSQNSEIVKSSLKKPLKIEKECQVECASLSQITQTVNITSEVDCQTVLAGEVKSCVTVCEKACLIKFPTFSQNTQTIFETLEHGSQTNITGNIIPKCRTSSCECQTILTGQVRKCASLTDKVCQTLCSRLVDKATQTEREKDDEMTAQKETNLDGKSLSLDNIPCEANTSAQSNHLLLVSPKEFCDISCQTRSTGAVMIKAIFHDDD